MFIKLSIEVSSFNTKLRPSGKKSSGSSFYISNKLVKNYKIYLKINLLTVKCPKIPCKITVKKNSFLSDLVNRSLILLRPR